MDHEKREQWEYALTEPLPNNRPRLVSVEQAEQDGQLFMTAMAQMKKG